MATPATWADLVPAPARDGAWLVPRMGQWGTVGAVAGAGWEAYAVLPHRVEPLPDGTVHPDAEPPEGSLDIGTATVLREVLTRHTAVVECRAALWEGYGWVAGSLPVSWLGRRFDPVPPAFPTRVLAARRLELPNRSHLVFEATLEALAPLVDPVSRVMGQSPTLFWPADHAWLVATEVDLDATVVGGSAPLVSDLAAVGGVTVQASDSVLQWSPWDRADRRPR